MERCQLGALLKQIGGKIDLVHSQMKILQVEVNSISNMSASFKPRSSHTTVQHIY